MSVFSLLVRYMHDGWERIRSMFYQDLGYLMVDWCSIVQEPCQENFVLRWGDGCGFYGSIFVGTPGGEYPNENDRSDSADEPEYATLDIISETVVCRYDESHEEVVCFVQGA